LIEGLDRIRDSYNVNGLGQVAALATLENLPYYHANFQKVIKTREALSQGLEESGFDVFPSQTNFILVRPPKMPAKAWLEELRARKILVRWFNYPAVRDYLRITIGTPEETRKLLMAASAILRRR
jgi:histidinol-phosphate aminotransferase